MTRLMPFALAAALAAAPLAAQEAPAAPDAAPEEDSSLLEQGAEMMFRGLLEEMRPGLEEFAGLADQLLPIFRTLAEEMGPAIADVAGQIDSLTYYEPPEILPNGDIVLRRRSDAPAWVPPEERPATESPAPDTEL